MFPLLLYLSLKQKICLLIYHTYLTSLLFSGKTTVGLKCLASSKSINA